MVTPPLLRWASASQQEYLKRGAFGNISYFPNSKKNYICKSFLTTNTVHYSNSLHVLIRPPRSDSDAHLSWLMCTIAICVWWWRKQILTAIVPLVNVPDDRARGWVKALPSLSISGAVVRDSKGLGDRLTWPTPRTEPMSSVTEQSTKDNKAGQNWNELAFNYLSHIRLTDFLLKQKTFLKTCNMSIIPPILPHEV